MGRAAGKGLVGKRQEISGNLLYLLWRSGDFGHKLASETEFGRVLLSVLLWVENVCLDEFPGSPPSDAIKRRTDPPTCLPDLVTGGATKFLNQGLASRCLLAPTGWLIITLLRDGFVACLQG